MVVPVIHNRTNPIKDCESRDEGQDIVIDGNGSKDMIGLEANKARFSSDYFHDHDTNVFATLKNTYDVTAADVISHHGSILYETASQIDLNPFRLQISPSGSVRSERLNGPIRPASRQLFET
eukprot:Ihof_evm1s1442 gene=Ihof_evmTU1s1442